MRKQFRDTVLDLASHDPRVVLLFGDISVYLFQEFQEKYPDRFYNIGICENTIISMAAGMSAAGFHPIAHSITPFITERSFEQIKLDMCYNEFGGNVASCGASFDYAWDGGTHHAYSELAILRMLPHMEVLQPGSKKELDVLLRSQYNNRKATYYRLSDHPHSIDLPVEFGKGVVIKENGARLTVMTAGPLLANVVEACEGLNVNLVYFHTIKPIDHELIQRFANTEIFVVSDANGLYEAICEVPFLRVSRHGLPDAFCGWYGTLQDIRRKLGLDAPSIRALITERLAT